MIEQQPCTPAAAGAFEMEVWTLVAELAKPLTGERHVTPVLIALRILASHLIRQTADPEETLRFLVADLTAAMAQKPVLAN
jgi:hypothetical protein